ncbi:MAG: hypothetical protein WCT10_02150 [Patescibacteria group bacterium]|jgi:hypothetical protein
MRSALKIIYGVLAVAAIIANFAVSGFIIATVHSLRLWAYPAYFGAYMALVGLFFIVLAPPKSKPHVVLPCLERFLTVDERKFSGGFWMRVRQRGAFALVTVSSLVFGPLFAAVVSRFLGLAERRAWMYSFLATLFTTAVWVSIYLGVTDVIRSLLAAIVGS